MAGSSPFTVMTNILSLNSANSVKTSCIDKFFLQRKHLNISLILPGLVSGFSLTLIMVV